MIKNKQIERIVHRWLIDRNLDNKISNFYERQENMMMTVFLKIADYIFYEPEIISDNINRTCHLKIKVGKRFYEKTSFAINIESFEINDEALYIAFSTLMEYIKKTYNFHKLQLNAQNEIIDKLNRIHGLYANRYDDYSLLIGTCAYTYSSDNIDENCSSIISRLLELKRNKLRQAVDKL